MEPNQPSLEEPKLVLTLAIIITSIILEEASFHYNLMNCVLYELCSLFKANEALRN